MVTKDHTLIPNSEPKWKTGSQNEKVGAKMKTWEPKWNTFLPRSQNEKLGAKMKNWELEWTSGSQNEKVGAKMKCLCKDYRYYNNLCRGISYHNREQSTMRNSSSFIGTPVAYDGRGNISKHLQYFLVGELFSNIFKICNDVKKL